MLDHVIFLPDTDVQASQAGVEKLEFELTNSLSAAIEEARTHVQEKCSSLSVCAMQYYGYGSDFIKSSGLRADPLIQLALQVYTCQVVTQHCSHY